MPFAAAACYGDGKIEDLSTLTQAQVSVMAVLGPMAGGLIHGRRAHSASFVCYFPLGHESP